MTFLLFLLAVAALGLLVVAVAQVMAWRGHRRGAAWTLITVGVVLFLGGVVLFAPQPLWVAACLIALGIVRLVKTTGDGRRRST